MKGVTKGYKGLQRVTNGYRVLLRVIGGYIKLQGATKGLQRIKKG